jgi:hypothetical protein
MIMRLAGAIGGMQAAPFMRLGEDPLVLELILRRARLYLGTIERVLGAPAGSVFPIDRDLVERFEQALKGEGVRENGA